MDDMTQRQAQLRREMVDVLPRVRRFAWSLTGSRDDGDDLLQATCERALSRLNQFRVGTRLDSWMYRIAQNLWRDRLRQQASRGVAADLDSVIDLSGVDGRIVVEGRSDLTRVARASMALPSEQRSVLHLVAVEGLSYREVAEVMETPIGTVMSRLARARRSLATALDTAGDGGGLGG